MRELLTLNALLSGWGLSSECMKPFKPFVRYDPRLRWLMILTEDVPYVACSENEFLEILRHEGRIVGVKVLSPEVVILAGLAER